MHDHRNGGPPHGLPDRDTLDYRAQQVVILELVVDPPAQGDRLDELAHRLRLPRPRVEPAVGVLERAGLAHRDGDVVRASRAALCFDYLWPVKP